MWAHDHPDRLRDIGSRRWIAAFGNAFPAVPVVVTEDSNGDYYGWMDTGDTHPAMIFPSLLMFKTCFPYGYEAEEKAGKGRMVRLLVRKAEIAGPQAQGVSAA